VENVRARRRLALAWRACQCGRANPTGQAMATSAQHALVSRAAHHTADRTDVNGYTGAVPTIGKEHCKTPDEKPTRTPKTGQYQCWSGRTNSGTTSRHAPGARRPPHCPRRSSPSLSRLLDAFESGLIRDALCRSPPCTVQIACDFGRQCSGQLPRRQPIGAGNFAIRSFSYQGTSREADCTKHHTAAPFGDTLQQPVQR